MFLLRVEERFFDLDLVVNSIGDAAVIEPISSLSGYEAVKLIIALHFFLAVDRF